MIIPGALAPGEFVILHKTELEFFGSCIYPTCHDKNSFNAKLDTHVDTHTCEKIRKNVVKYIRCASRFRIAKIPVKQLIKPFGGD